MTRREIITEFLLFLKKNNAQYKYKKNMMKQKSSHFITIENKINPLTIEPMKLLLTREYYHELINCAFRWAQTEEGHNYWYKLDYKWRRKINHINNKLI